MKGKSEESDSYSDPLLQPSGNSPGNWRTYGYASSFSSPTINEEVEVEAGSDAAETCWICLEHNSADLIAPCKCKGTQQFVHRLCLDHWRSVKEGFAFAHCTTCRAQYHLRINFLEGSCWRSLKFRMFVARDILLVFLAVQTIISMLGGLSFLFDPHGSFRKSFNHDWDRIFSNHPVFFYYCLGALIFFALIGIFGLGMQCSSCGEIDPYRTSSAEAESIYCCNGPCLIESPNCDSGDHFAGVLVLVLVAVIVFAVIGIFYGIFAATIGLQRIWQRHYHILTKTELTKEYMVEDLHGCYTPPKLDSEHAERLRMLKLL